MFHVITPLARFENVEKLINVLEPKNIQWHVLIDQGYSHDNIKYLTDKSWIKVYYCPNDGVVFYERCNKSINWFIETQQIIDNEMYCILNDDDAYEPEFFTKIKASIQKTGSPIIITSMERGHAIPESAVGCRAHPPTKLWGYPENVRENAIGVEQIIIKGELLKKYRIPTAPSGDGMFIVKAVRENGAAFCSEADVWFNYFEPGRWNV